MSLLMRRLGREAARAILDRQLAMSIEAVADEQPNRGTAYTYSPVGGTRVDDDQLLRLRREVLTIAREHGYPHKTERTAQLEGQLARTMHESLPMTANEASQEEVWSYLTCCWLLDIAIWRFGPEADIRRFIGDVNRNAFRRLWWRAEVLGPDVPLEQMGEDELVSIMERPTIAGDRRLARAIATEFLRQVEADEPATRMMLMRDTMKRLLRLTPFVSFEAIDDDELGLAIATAFAAAAAGLSGIAAPDAPEAARSAPEPSPEVTAIESRDDAIAAITDDDDGRARGSGGDLEVVAQIAEDIARRTGRVTNIMLREVITITSAEAREVLQDLVNSGRLARRGVRRGTYYVIADRSAPSTSPTQSALRRLLGRDGHKGRAAEALLVVEQHPGLTIPEIAERMGIKRNYLYRVLPDLERAGKLMKQGRGWYPG